MKTYLFFVLQLLFVEEITREQLKGSHVYHLTTGRRNARSIVENGFDWTIRKEDLEDEVFVERVVSKKEIDYPVDRKRAVFCYPFLKTVEKRMGTAVVVDLEKVDCPVYVSDIAAYDDVIRVTPFDRKKSLTEEQIDTVVEYVSTIQRANTWYEAKQLSETMEEPEIIIDGQVTDSAIEGVLFQN